MQASRAGLLLPLQHHVPELAGLLCCCCCCLCLHLHGGWSQVHCAAADLAVAAAAASVAAAAIVAEKAARQRAMHVVVVAAVGVAELRWATLQGTADADGPRLRR